MPCSRGLVSLSNRQRVAHRGCREGCSSWPRMWPSASGERKSLPPPVPESGSRSGYRWLLIHNPFPSSPKSAPTYWLLFTPCNQLFPEEAVPTERLFSENDLV